MHRFIAKMLHMTWQPPPSKSETPPNTPVAREGVGEVPNDAPVAATKANVGVAQVSAASRTVDASVKSPSSTFIPRKPVPKSTSVTNAPPPPPPPQFQQRPICTCPKPPPQDIECEKAHSLRHPQPSSSSHRTQPFRPQLPPDQAHRNPPSGAPCPLHPSKTLSSNPQPANPTARTRFHSQQPPIRKTHPTLEKTRACHWRTFAAHELIRKQLLAQLKTGKANNNDWGIATAYVRAAACGIPFHVANEPPRKSLKVSAAGFAVRVVAGIAKVREDAATRRYRQRVRHLQDLRKTLAQYAREYSKLRGEQHRIAATIRVLRARVSNPDAEPSFNTEPNSTISITHNAANNRSEQALSVLARSTRKARAEETKVRELVRSMPLSSNSVGRCC